MLQQMIHHHLNTNQVFYEIQLLMEHLKMQKELSQQTFPVFQDVFSITLFVFQDVLKTS